MVKNSYVDNQALLSYWHHAIPPSRYATNCYSSIAPIGRPPS